MIYQYLGQSSLKVSRLSLGGNVFGYLCNQDQTKTLMAQALEWGINFVDTADVYSEGASEQCIGLATTGCREKWVIATKVGVRSQESSNGKGRREYIFKSVEQSLRRLKTDYIDLLQMHHVDRQTPFEETIQTLEMLVAQGKIRYYGVCNYSVEALKKIQSLRQQGQCPFLVTLQTTYNLFKRNIETDILPLCQQMNLSVLIFGALARGVLAGQYHSALSVPEHSRAKLSASIRSDLTPDVLTVVSHLKEYAHRFDRPVNQLALAWLFNKKELGCLIVGVRDAQQLDSNLQAMHWNLSVQDYQAIDDLMGSLKKFDSLCLGAFG